MGKTCIYAIASEEAYKVDMRTGQQIPCEVLICEWPEQNPGRFINAPRWLQDVLGGGLAIKPERDCVGCAAFKASPEAE